MELKKFAESGNIDKLLAERLETAEIEEDPFSYDNDNALPPPTRSCPVCGEDGYLSYYMCDEEPPLFKGVLWECHGLNGCGNMWES